MATNNAESFKFKIITTGNQNVDERKPSKLTKVTLEKVLAWIDSKKLDKLVTEELKRAAGSYPENALEAWMKSFGTHVSRARRIVAQRKLRTPQEDPSKVPLESCGEMSAEHDTAIDSAPENPEFD